MTYPWPGIREDLYVEGVAFVRTPLDVTPRWMTARDSKRARSGKLYRDSLQPETGYPVTLAKLELTLSWGAMAPEDIRSVNGLLSRDAIVDVCNWVEIAESFYLAAGASLAGTLLRRNALAVISPLPPLAATRHAVAATRGDGSALTVTLGTPDADGHTPWTATGTSVGEYVTIHYTPVYMMAAEDGQTTFPRGQQGQTLVLVEA